MDAGIPYFKMSDMEKLLARQDIDSTLRRYYKLNVDLKPNKSGMNGDFYSPVNFKEDTLIFCDRFNIISTHFKATAYGDNGEYLIRITTK